MSEETKQCTACGRRFSDDALFCPKDGSALVPVAAVRGKDDFLGREILGHIEVRTLIGAGAMGRVYRAHQKGIDRDVAVKILHKELAQNGDLVARFLREAKVASRLNHPNVVQVLLAGQLEDRTMYLVMEHLDGVSLQSALLVAGGSLPLPRALHIGLQICDAVGEAHTVGVVHRDVKPENVMLVRRGEDEDFVKVLDFGIAHLTQKESGIETQAGLVFGTARYLSPEGARGEPVGPTSDVYAIATLLYQMIVGRTPFEHDSSVSLLVAQIHDVAPPLRSFQRASYVHPAIEAAIMKNLAKDASARDPDGHSFGRALLEAATTAGFHADDLVVRPAVARIRKNAPPPSMPIASSEKTREQAFGLGAGTPNPSPVEPQRPPVAAAAEPDSGQGGAVYHPSYSGKPIVGATPAPGPAGVRRVDQTLDDVPSPKAPLPATVGMQAPQPLGAATVGMPLPQPTPPTAAMPMPDPRPSTPPQVAAASTSNPPNAPNGMLASSSPGTDDSMLGTASTPRDDLGHPAGVPRRGKLGFVIALLFIVTLSALGIGGYRLGYFGNKPTPTSKRPEVDDLLARADAAYDARQWDSPPGENVVELTDKLLQLAPGETRTLKIRSDAANKIIREALDAKAKHDLVNALRLFKLVARLSPPDEGIQHEIESIEADIANDPTLASAVTDGAALRYAAVVVVVAKDPAGPVVYETTSLQASVHDGPGEGALDPKSADPKAHFVISGPGLAKEVELPAKAEGTTKYTATYQFKQAGTFTVTFFARPDNYPLKASFDAKVTAAKATAPVGIWPTAKPTGSTTLKPVPPTGTVILTPDPGTPVNTGPFPTVPQPPFPTP